MNLYNRYAYLNSIDPTGQFAITGTIAATILVMTAIDMWVETGIDLYQEMNLQPAVSFSDLQSVAVLIP